MTKGELNQLITTLMPKLRGIAARELARHGNVSHLDADDLTNEALIVTLRTYEQGRLDPSNLARSIIQAFKKDVKDARRDWTGRRETSAKWQLRSQTRQFAFNDDFTHDPADNREAQRNAIKDELDAVKAVLNEDDCRLIDLLAAGYTQEEAAGFLGITPGRVSQRFLAIRRKFGNATVISRAHRARRRKEDQQKCFELRAAGRTHTSIAEELNISTPTVSLWLKAERVRKSQASKGEQHCPTTTK